MEHETQCRLGLFREEIDLNSIELFKKGSSNKELTLIVPKRLMNFIPHHIKTAPQPPLSYSIHEFNYAQKFELYACLLLNNEENPEEPHLKPISIRSHTNLKLGFWTNFAKSKDPTNFL